MTTRTLTVQADQRAYVPHALCIVKRTSFARLCLSKTSVLCVPRLCSYAGAGESLPHHVRALSLFTILKRVYSTAIVSRLS